MVNSCPCHRDSYHSLEAGTLPCFARMGRMDRAISICECLHIPVEYRLVDAGHQTQPFDTITEALVKDIISSCLEG